MRRDIQAKELARRIRVTTDPATGEHLATWGGTTYMRTGPRGEGVWMWSASDAWYAAGGPVMEWRQIQGTARRFTHSQFRALVLAANRALVLA